MERGSLNQSQLIRMWTMVFVRVLLVLIVCLAVLWALYALRTILLLLVLSIFFCYMVAPMVRVFEQSVYIRNHEIKLPRGIAIGLVYMAIGAVMVLASWLILPVLQQQASELAANLPGYLSTGSGAVQKTFEDAGSWLNHLNLPVKLRESLQNQLSRMAETIFPVVSDLVTSALGYLTYLPWLIIVPILSFFLLKDAESFEQTIVELLPERLQKRAHWLLLDVSNTLAAYIRAQVTACMVIGALVTVGLALIGVPYALVLGLIAGVLEFVPLVGPLVAAAVTFGLTLTTSFKLALWAAIFLAVLRVVHDYIIYPRIVGQGIKIHPLMVVLAILGGEQIGGLPGIFLAIPFVGLVIVIYHHYIAYRGMQAIREEVTSSQPPLDDLEADSDLEPDLVASGSSPPPLEK